MDRAAVGPRRSNGTARRCACNPVVAQEVPADAADESSFQTPGLG